MSREKASIRVLKNGLEVVFLRSSSAPVIALDLWVRSGSTSETKREAGLAHVVEHMLFKGTKTRGPGEIAAEIESLGGEINAYTSFDHTVYTILLASRYAKTGLEILADALFCSRFDEAELSSEKLVIVEEIKRSRDMPQHCLSRNLFKTAYGHHPYGLPVIGCEDSVMGFSSGDCQSFVGKWYRPSNMTLVAVGDMAEEKFFSLAQDIFGQEKPLAKAASKKLPSKIPLGGFRGIVEQKPVGEVYFDLAFPIPSAGHGKIPAIDLFAAILGQGEASRLQERVKLDKNLVVSVGAGTYTPKGPGLLYVGGVSSVAKFEQAFGAISAELAEMSKNPPSTEEIRRAKEGIEADFVFQKETVQGLAQKIGYFHVVHGGAEAEGEYLSSIEGLDAKKILASAKEVLKPEKAVYSAVRPAKKSSVAATETAKRILFASFSHKTKVSRGPDERRIVLPCGATLLFKRCANAPIAAIRAAMKGGTLLERSGEEGAYYLLADALPKGTKKRTVFDIAREGDRIGGHVEGFSGRNSFGLKGEFLSKHTEAALDLFCDILQNPALSAVEVEKSKEDQLAAIKRRDDNPASKAFRAFEKLLFGEHPYGNDLLGTLESAKSLTPDALLTLHRTGLNPKGLAIALVGDVDAERATQKIADALSLVACKRKASPLPLPAPPKEPSGPRTLRLDSPHEQAHVVAGFLGVSLKERDRYALRVINAMLSGQGGRLFKSLRDDKGLAYSVTSTSIEGIHRGYIAGYIATSPKNAPVALEGLLAEMRSLAEGKFTEKEVRQAAQKLAGTFELSLQENDFRAAQMALDEIYGLNYKSYLGYAKTLLAVTPEEVERAARKYMGTDNFCAVIVGPGS